MQCKWRPRKKINWKSKPSSVPQIIISLCEKQNAWLPLLFWRSYDSFVLDSVRNLFSVKRTGQEIAESYLHHLFIKAAIPSKSMTKIDTLYFVPIIKIINATFSAVACATFLYFQRYAVVLEYTQIWFLSALVCVLDSETGVFRNIYFALLTLVGAAWIVAAVYVESWHQPLYAQILLSYDAFVYMAGSIACAAAIVNRPTRSTTAAEKNRLIEIDLLIYVVSLNALSVFPVNAFNTNLHMVLDIRLVVLLYTGLYRPANKMELLNNVSFLVVMFSIVLFFAMYSISLDNPVIIACASVVNSTIGVVLLYQAWYHFYAVYPQYNNVPDIRNENEKDETVDNISSSVESPLIE